MTVEQLGRAVQAYRRTATSRSAIVLIAANAIPIAGVLFFGWSLHTILVLYWLENGIVGLWNLPRILLAQGSVLPVLPPLADAAARSATPSDAAAKQLQADWERIRDAQLRAAATVSGDVGATPGFARVFGTGRMPSAGRAALAVFFTFHYGMFWFVHGIFVFALPAFVGAESRNVAACGDPDPFGALQPCGTPFGEIVWSNVAIAGAALFLSHGASFLFNYIGRGEYLTSSATRQMGAPYGRVVVLHLTIIFGAFAIAIIGAPVGALLILVGLKIAFDLGLHLREHRTADARVPADTAYGRLVRGGDLPQPPA
jgi:hypothetical protein